MLAKLYYVCNYLWCFNYCWESHVSKLTECVFCFDCHTSLIISTHIRSTGDKFLFNFVANFHLGQNFSLLRIWIEVDSSSELTGFSSTLHISDSSFMVPPAFLTFPGFLHSSTTYCTQVHLFKNSNNLFAICLQQIKWIIRRMCHIYGL